MVESVSSWSDFCETKSGQSAGTMLLSKKTGRMKMCTCARVCLWGWCLCRLRLCVCRPISYFIVHIQTMHPKTHRATYILARGLMNAENPVGPSAVSKLSPWLHSRCRSMIFFSQGGATNPHPFVAISLSRSLPPWAKPVSYQGRYSQHSCVPIPSPFTARFQGTLVADDVTTVLVPE